MNLVQIYQLEALMPDYLSLIIIIIYNYALLKGFRFSLILCC